MQALASILKKLGFVLVNVWLVFHLIAIATSPAPMPPASPLLVDTAMVALPYNQMMFLNHGYHYFAPDPGASTLLEYRIDRRADVPVKGRFPDTKISPRLLYHRYFMLAENVWGFPEETQDEMFEAYGRHFAAKHDADNITLSSVSHNPSSIARIRAGGKLSDPETYEIEPLESYNFGESEVTSVLKPPFRETELQPEPVDADTAESAEPGSEQPAPMTPIPMTQ